MKSVLLLVIFCSSLCFTDAQIYHVQDLSTVQIQALDHEKIVVLLPGGILEQHGPYLPSFTDGYMNLAITDSIAHAIVKNTGRPVLIFPLIPLGNGGANEIGRKYNFPGTYTVRASTLRTIFMDLGSELGEQGFKHIFVIHMHGSPNHNHAIDQACDYFNEEYKGKMMNVWNLAIEINKDFRSEVVKKLDGFTVHAGAAEHSMLYYLQPQFKSLGYQKASAQKASGPNELGTVAMRPGWLGYFGAPALATTELGRQSWQEWTRVIISGVTDVLNDRYDFSKPTYYKLMLADPDQSKVNDDAAKHDAEREQREMNWIKREGSK
jgi:creatinine amidohydrolase